MGLWKCRSSWSPDVGGQVGVQGEAGRVTGLGKVVLQLKLGASLRIRQPAELEIQLEGGVAGGREA